MNNDDIAERLEGVDIEPLTAVLRDGIEILLANDPTYFGGSMTTESTKNTVANLRDIVDLVIAGHKHIWKYYDGMLGYESLVCERCGVDINDYKDTAYVLGVKETK